MMRTHAIAAGVVGIALFWAGVAAQQEARSTPGLGSGIVKVTGAVDVANTPTVEALQAGQWTVAFAAPAEVRVANTARVAFVLPEFLQRGGRYIITWPGGERETCTVEQVGSEAWVRTTIDGHQRWINVAMARSVEQAR